MFEDVQDAARVILDVNPVANLTAVAVERHRLAVKQIRRKERDQFLRILVRAVSVRAARDDDGRAVRRAVGENLKVAAGFACGVWRARFERITFLGTTARNVTVNFISRNLQEARDAMFAHSFEQDVRAENVGAQKLFWIEDRAVDVRFGGELRIASIFVSASARSTARVSQMLPRMNA